MDNKDDKKRNPNYKYCVVPECKNTTLTVPDKVFITMPKDEKARQIWQQAMRKTDLLSKHSRKYCCEDHFNLEEDMENYMYFKLMKNVPIKLKPGVMPHIFDCQEQRTVMHKKSPSKAILKSERHEKFEASTSPKRICLAGAASSENLNLSLNHIIIQENTGEGRTTVPDLKVSHTDLEEKLRLNNVMDTSNKLFECDICLSKFKQRKTLNQHLKVHTGEQPFECDICHKKFRQSGNLNTHIKLHTGDKPFECNLCDEKFTVRGNLNDHLRLHTGEKPFQCDICEATFRLKRNLVEHRKVHSGKLFECEICQKRFRQMKNLNEHRKVHNKKSGYECDICHKKFKRRKSLIKHRNGTKPFECDICHRKFRHKGTMNIHRLIHTDEKPFQCDTCHKRYLTRTHLVAHIKIHTGERPFECEVCHKKFRQKGSLNVHTRIHTGEKPFECDICHRKFSQRVSLRVHLKLHKKKLSDCEEGYKKITQLKQEDDGEKEDISNTNEQLMMVNAGEIPSEINFCDEIKPEYEFGKHSNDTLRSANTNNTEFECKIELDYNEILLEGMSNVVEIKKEEEMPNVVEIKKEMHNLVEIKNEEGMYDMFEIKKEENHEG